MVFRWQENRFLYLGWTATERDRGDGRGRHEYGGSRRSPIGRLRPGLLAGGYARNRSPGGRGRPNPARVRPQDAKYEEDFLSTIGVDFVRGAPPLAPLRRSL